MATSKAPIDVLHVDDEPAFAELTVEFLEKEDDTLRVETASSAEEGLERLNGHIDCIVSDHEMPGRNGIEFLEAVRERRPEVPFILFTGKGSEEVASEAISAGVTDYLQKRGASDQYALLANKVRNAVDNYRSGVAIREQNRAFESFIEIVNDESRAFDQQMRDVLDLGREFLGLDNGIISRIEPPDYHIENVATPDGSIEPGDTFDFSDTFCELVFAADEAVAFRSPAAGGVEDHPCYQEMGLEAYLGEPLIVDGERFGTLNFSSPSPREEPFTDGEQAFIRTLAEWISKELSRRRTLEQVESQRKELERQNERLEQFTSFISHDLRNPLNVAQGRVELAQEEFEGEDLTRAERALERSQRLIDDLLALARDRNGVINTEATDLSELADRCWKNVETAEATIDLQTESVIEADPGRLQQLLENLFRNAVEHGGDDVSVTVGDLGDGFYVEDDGPGIPEDDREQVFEMGYSTDSDGTGFGLSIVKEVTDSHGWDLRVIEADNGGARFEITGIEFA